MNNYLRILLIITLISAVFTVSAQTEICNNSIDDDGDGFVDCFDPDCSDSIECEDFFFGNSVTCEDEVDVKTFAVRKEWTSADGTATSYATPMIGDLDQNGIPEVVVVNDRGDLDLFVLNGATGETIASIDIGFLPERTPVLADIDNDDTGEIIVSNTGGGSRLAVYKVDFTAGTLNLVWQRSASRIRIGHIGVADFDEDGDVEIYYRNEIMNAVDGSILIAGNKGWDQDYISHPIAADIFEEDQCSDCKGLELITGNQIWSINEDAGTRTVVADLNDLIHRNDATLNFYPKATNAQGLNRSSASVADYNQDGDLDIILSGALGGDLQSAETTVFFWDVANGNYMTWADGKNFTNGTGRINVGDVDGDGKLNASFVMDQELISLDENFRLHWDFPIKEGSSGFTGCSLFDFDGDGSVEIVYRSEENLFILRGDKDLSDEDRVTRSILCRSRTREEYPVIADVDGDGSSEICVTCFFDDTTPFDPITNTEYGSVRVYGADGESWVPARKVWNQHGYYNVNINDDLTVPREIQNHAVTFAAADICEYADGTPIPFNISPLNTFLNQSPILNMDGCLEFVAPDIKFSGTIEADPITCPGASTQVRFELTNTGDADISGNLPISYYAGGDPRTSAEATLLDTEMIFLENLKIGETLSVAQNISAVGGESELFVVLNNNGSMPPIGENPTTATIPECDTENNIERVATISSTFDLMTEVIKNNEVCADSYVDSDGDTINVNNNGAARAYFFGTVPRASGAFWLENFEDQSIGTTNDTEETSWSSDPGSIGPMFYGVENYTDDGSGRMFKATHTGNNNEAGIVTWTSEAIDISGYTDISVSMDLFERGNLDGSGDLRDFIRVEYELRDISDGVTRSGEFDSGEHYGDFDYARAELSGINDAGQNDASLIIKVSMHSNSDAENHYIDNIKVQGTANLISGELTEAEGFEFEWYDIADIDFSDVLNSTSTFTQMDGGDYRVLARFPETVCYSDTVTVTIPEIRPDIYVWAYEEAPNTNCENPNGIASAFVYTSTQDGSFPATTTNPPQDTLVTADGYEFTWFFEGDAATPIGTGTRLSNRNQTGYNVEVFQHSTACTSSRDVEITSANTNVTGVNTNVVNITECEGTGTLSADVGGTTTGYTFYWYDGDAEKPTPDFQGASYEVDNEGEFLLIVENDVSKCEYREVLGVADNSIKPEPSIRITSQNTYCVNGNGVLTADGDGAGGTDGYRFEWFLGRNTLAANALPGSADEDVFFVSGDSSQLGGLKRGAYTVRVTETATGCTATARRRIRDNSRPLTVDPDAMDTDVTIISCDPSVSASLDASGVVRGSGDYEFELYDGNTVTGTPDLTNTTGLFNVSEAGNYSLLVADSITGCVAPRIPITITREEPDITPAIRIIRDNFSCDIANPTGSATLTIAEGPNTNYSFRWYRGTSATGTVIDSDSLINNQLHGTYTVLITDNATNCTQTARAVIREFTPTLTVRSSSNTDHSDCYPANGEVTVVPNLAFTPTGTLTGFTADYDYQWYFGSSATAGNELEEGVDPGNLSTPTDVTTDNVTRLAAGDYTVVITETQTGCISAIETVTVDDEVSPYRPTIAFTSDIIPSECDNSDGQITAEITGMPATASAANGGTAFSFEWYEGAQDFASLATTGSGTELTNGESLVAAPGNTITVANSGGTGLGATATLGRIVSGLYTLVTIDNVTGCRFSDMYELGYQGQQVTTALTVDNVEECPDDGVARVGLADNITLTVANTPARTTMFTVGEAFTTSGGASGTIASDDGAETVQIALGEGSPTPATTETITSAGVNAVINGVANDGYTPGQSDDITQYIVYLYAGSGVPANRLDSYTYEGKVFPYTYNPVTGVRLDGDGNALTAGPGSGLNPGQEASFPELPAGDYIAIAREIPNPAFSPATTRQCWTSASLNEEILDVAYEPVIQSRTVVNSTNCDETNGNGSISLTVIEDPDENRNPSASRQPNGYRFEWVDGDGNTVLNEDIGTETATSNPDNLNPGSYTVIIQRLGAPGGAPNNCEVSTTVNVRYNPEEHLITGATVIDNDACVPLDGSITIANADITGNTDEYEYTWYTTYVADGDPGNVLLADANVDGGDNGDPGVNRVSQLGGGTYFVQAEQVAGIGTCITNVFEVEVEDNRLNPIISVELSTADSTCAPGFTPEGTLSATVTLNDGTGPFDDTDADYAFQWYSGVGTGTIITGETNSTINDLDAGTYTLEVERVSTGCTAIQEFELPNVPTTVEILDADTVSSINCDGNGTITVTSVSRDNVADYDFDYYNTDPTAGSSVPVFQSNLGGAYTAAVPGTYWIIGTNTIVGCTTPPFEAVIGENFEYPTLTLEGFDNQSNCDPGIPNGRLSVLANGEAEGANYDFEWYFGDDTTNPLTADDYPGGTELTGANTNEISGIAAGTYTVEVTDLNTRCTVTRTEMIQDDIPNPIAISTSSSANTNCDNFNGAVAVSVITPARGRSVNDYHFYWFIGDLTTVGASPDTTAADFTGTLVQNLEEGDYVVLAVDEIDRFCQSNATQVTIEDETNRQNTPYTLNINDVMVCFDQKSGGASVVLTNPTDSVTTSIEWQDEDGNRVGSLVSNSEFVIDSLEIGTYRMILTDNNTLCPTMEIFEITDASMPPNAPSVQIINNRTNCLEANGNAIANVDGSTLNLVFEWFDPTNMTTPMFTGSNISVLDSITYLVRATDISTGCASSLTQVDVLYEITDPVFSIEANNSLCLRTEDGVINQFTGTAIVNFEEFNDASLTSYEWIFLETNEVVSTGSRLIDAIPGNYGVRFVADNGCEYYDEFEISIELTIYNGISANGDRRNDFFLIDCLDLFPNNNVKIFNRAGQKIYDVDFYNNASTRFEGLSNVGAGGLVLPAGTYFYLIDLGTGGDLIQGYLELVR